MKSKNRAHSSVTFVVNRRWISLLAAAFIAVAALWAQSPDAKTSKPAQSNPKQGQPTTPAPQQPSENSPSLPPIPLDGNAALHHLNEVISWYRHATTGIHSVGLPSDAIYQDNTRELASQAVRLAFQSAKVESLIITQQQKAAGSNAETTQQQNLAQLEAKTSARIDDLQSQLEAVNAQIAKVPASRRAALISQRDAVQGQLELQKALLDAIQKMSKFVETNGEMAAGLEGSINQLGRSIPEVLGTSNVQKTTTPPASTKPTISNSGGLISEALTLYDYMSTSHEIGNIIRETDTVRDVADQLRTPLRNALRATIQESESISNQPPATGPQQLQAEREQFQQLTQRFKQLSDAVLPLSQELVILNDAKTNFGEWRDSIERESKYVLRSLLLRVLAIAIALAVIIILSEVWRRITFRYIGDPRRRRQFLVLRRVVIGFLVVVVLIMGFVSEFSSLATFAGFITAGIAVGLQAVLLSVAAYFFIIGRYGIRVGDRISVAGITGDVVDIGLVRLYLMELAGTGLDFYPTGRIVVFSNAVLFQTGTPLFKQIPGTDYAWHEVVVMVAPEGNHKAAQEKLVAAVNSIYSQYQKEIERQHANIERRVDIQISTPRPEARLQFADTGLELLVRYPVEIRKAPDIDEKMTRKVLELIETDAELKKAVSGVPKIRSAVKG
jgi:small-conductance mechanosensitive channel